MGPDFRSHLPPLFKKILGTTAQLALSYSSYRYWRTPSDGFPRSSSQFKGLCSMWISRYDFSSKSTCPSPDLPNGNPKLSRLGNWGGYGRFFIPHGHPYRRCRSPLSSHLSYMATGLYFY